MKSTKGYIIPDGYTADIGVFTYHENKIKILLLKRKGNVEAQKWALPGGFVDYELAETAHDTAIRELKEETNLNIDSIFMRHVAIFDRIGRDSRGWIISNAFYCVLDYNFIHTTVKKNDESYELALFDINQVLELDLAFDHNEVISKLIENLRADIYNNIFLDGYFKNNYVLNILGEEFFITDVHNLVQFAGLNIDRSTIYRKIERNSFFKDQGFKKVSGVKKPIKSYSYLTTKDKND